MASLTVEQPSPVKPSIIPWGLLPYAIFTLSVMGAVGVMLFVPDFAKIAFMLPLAVIIGLTVMVRPELAVVLSIAYVPFESSHFQPVSLPGGLSISKILGAMLLGVFFFNILLRRKPFRLLDDTQDFLVVLLAAAMLLSGVTSYFPEKTFDSASRMIRMFAFYFAVKNLLNSFIVIRASIWAITLTGTIATLWGINEFIEMSKVRIHTIRVRGVYMDPNDYAALAVVVVLVSLHLVEMTKNRILRGLVIACVGINLAGILLSASRGALLALGVAMGIYILRHPRRKMIMMVLAVSVVVTFPFWPESVTTRLLGDDDDALSQSVYSKTAENSTERRASYIVFGAEIIADHPVLGAGYGTFSYLYPRSAFARYDNPMTDAERFRLAHNAYLEMAVGIGFIGLGIFLLIWFVTWRDLFRIGRSNPRGSLLWGAANGFELALVSLMVASFFLSIEHFNYTWIAVAMSSALAFHVRATQQQTEQQQQDAQPLLPDTTHTG